MSDVILAITVRKLVVVERKSIVIGNVCKNDGKKIYLRNLSSFLSLSLSLSRSLYLSIFLKIILSKKSKSTKNYQFTLSRFNDNLWDRNLFRGR
jgi:hypothetical protein